MSVVRFDATRPAAPVLDGAHLEHFADVLVHERPDRRLRLVGAVGGFFELDPRALRRTHVVSVGPDTALPREPQDGGIDLQVLLRLSRNRKNVPSLWKALFITMSGRRTPTFR